MHIVERVALLVGQVLGVAGAVLGVLLLWGLGWALLAVGVALVVGCTALEAVALRRPVAPSRRRVGPNSEGVA